MHNIYPQLGNFSPQLGCAIYDEKPQMGQTMGLTFKIGDAIDSAVNTLKQLAPQVGDAVLRDFVANTPTGQSLVQTGVNLGEQAMISQAAQQVATIRSQLELQYENFKKNWQKYLLWTGIAAVTVVGGYMIIKRTRRVASNPRRKRRYKRRK